MIRFEIESSDGVICPYCGRDNEEWVAGNNITMFECVGCGKVFLIKVEVVKKWKTAKLEEED